MSGRFLQMACKALIIIIIISYAVEPTSYAELLLYTPKET
jgi:hypothetical protein